MSSLNGQKIRGQDYDVGFVKEESKKQQLDSKLKETEIYLNNEIFQSKINSKKRKSVMTKTNNILDLVNFSRISHGQKKTPPPKASYNLKSAQFNHYDKPQQ